MIREWDQPESGRANLPEPEFERVVEAAQGFFQLEMWEDAWSELENLRPEFRHLPPVLLIRILILNNMGRWEYSVVIGKGAIAQYPNYSPLYPAVAHAIRHFEDPAAAKAVLLSGEAMLKEEAIYHFMLATFECQLGEFEAAKASLTRALQLNKRLRSKALDEPDLGPLWESL